MGEVTSHRIFVMRFKLCFFAFYFTTRTAVNGCKSQRPIHVEIVETTEIPPREEERESTIVYTTWSTTSVPTTIMPTTTTRLLERHRSSYLERYLGTPKPPKTDSPPSHIWPQSVKVFRPSSIQYDEELIKDQYERKILHDIPMSKQIQQTSTTSTMINTITSTTVKTTTTRTKTRRADQNYRIMNLDVPLSSRSTCWSNSFRYDGLRNRTKSGIICQPWEEEFPHVPRHRPIDASAEFNHNFCRNPDGDPNGPWCYTTNPRVRYEYCGVPACGNSDAEKAVISIADCFRGNPGEYDTLVGNHRLNITKSGIPCQRWDQNSPHTPKTRPHDALNNFCSDNDGDPGGAWCYTVDPNVRWEYCNVKYQCDRDNRNEPEAAALLDDMDLLNKIVKLGIA